MKVTGTDQDVSSLLRSIRNFDRECRDEEYTDTDVANELLARTATLLATLLQEPACEGCGEVGLCECNPREDNEGD